MTLSTYGIEAMFSRVDVTDAESVVAFLGSDEASIITGAFYLADGGYTAR